MFWQMANILFSSFLTHYEKLILVRISVQSVFQIAAITGFMEDKSLLNCCLGSLRLPFSGSLLRFST